MSLSLLLTRFSLQLYLSLSLLHFYFHNQIPSCPFYLTYWVLAIFEPITNCVTHMQTYYVSTFIPDICRNLLSVPSLASLTTWLFPPVRCRRCCTMTGQCWRTTMLRLPGASTCPGQSSTSWSTWITWSSSVFASLSSRLYWPQTSRSTLTSWLSSMLRSEMKKS